MADIASSVLARLKNKASASGRSYQLCLQLFCQEEFLRRLLKIAAALRRFAVLIQINIVDFVIFLI